AAALNAFDTNGHFQSGAAIDVVPFLTFASKSFSLGQYADSGMKAYAIRLLARTSVSFATTKGTSSPDTSIRLATGFRISLIDLNDPRALFQRCIGKIDMIVNPENPDQAPSAQDQQEIAACRKKAKGVW